MFLIAKTAQDGKMPSSVCHFGLLNTYRALSSARHSLKGKMWEVTHNTKEQLSAHLLQPPIPNNPRSESMTGSYFLSGGGASLAFNNVWKLNLSSAVWSLFNSSLHLRIWCFDFVHSWLCGLTSRVLFVAHLKVDASVKLSGDQSIGHDHDQPWDGEEHQQDENIPKETLREVRTSSTMRKMFSFQDDQLWSWSVLNFTLFF